MRPLIINERVGDVVVRTDDIPLVIDPETVEDRTGTVLDPDVLEHGCWLRLPDRVGDYANRTVDRVWLPPVPPLIEDGTWVLHPITWMGNQVLRVSHQFKKETTPYIALQRMVLRYQSIAERELVGKTGLIRNVVIGARMKHSGRAVLIPNGHYHPKEVGIPGRFFDDMGIQHHDYIMIGRNPTIWSGSIEIVLARRSPEDCVELHPLLFWQLGGDCDGDDVYFVPVPKTDACQQEAKEALISFTMAHATWKKQALWDDENTAVHWAGPKGDTKSRFTVSGFSISPAEIAGPKTEIFEKLERVTEKSIWEPCFRIAKGLPENEIQDILQEKNHETLRMKTHLGLIGIACNRLKILADRVHSWVESANYLSERLQQVLLDAKHLDGSYSVFEVLEILNKTGNWRNKGYEDALAQLEAIEGVDAEECRPIVQALYIAYPCRMALEDILPATVSVRKYWATLTKMGTIRPELVLGKVESQLRADGLGGLVSKCRKMANTYSTGLVDVTASFFPLHELIASRKPSLSLTRRVFRHGILDISGPCRQAWEVWHKAAGIHR